MAGSQRPREYTGDDGLGYVVNIDETWGELANAGFTDISAATLAANRVLKLSSTKPIEARFVIGKFTDASGDTFTRKRYIGSTTAALWTGAATTFPGDDGNTYSVTFYSGEKRSRVPQFDTGIKDGDVDDNFAA